MYQISRFVYVLHWLATRLVGPSKGENSLINDVIFGLLLNVIVLWGFIHVAQSNFLGNSFSAYVNKKAFPYC